MGSPHSWEGREAELAVIRKNLKEQDEATKQQQETSRQWATNQGLLPPAHDHEKPTYENHKRKSWLRRLIQWVQ